MAERWDLRENNGVAVHRTLNSRKKIYPKIKDTRRYLYSMTIISRISSTFKQKSGLVFQQIFPFQKLRQNQRIVCLCGFYVFAFY